MAKKKLNPNRIPISADSYNIQEIVNKATASNVLRGWGLVLGALANFEDTTTDKLLDLWREVNRYSTTIHNYNDVAKELKIIEEIAKIKIPFEQIKASHIRTQGDLDKFIRKTNQNALYAAMAIIADPIIKQKMFSDEDTALVFRKAYELEEEIGEGRISFEDIVSMLEDEYGLILCVNEHGQAVLTCKDRDTELRQEWKKANRMLSCESSRAMMRPGLANAQIVFSEKAIQRL